MSLERRYPSWLSFLKLMSHWGKRSWWVSIIVWFVMIAPAWAALELRVAIEENTKEVNVGSSTRAIVRDGAGKVLGEISAMNGFAAQTDKGKVLVDNWEASQIWIEPTAGGYVYIGDRWYRGRTLLIPTAQGLTAINYVDLEHYLYSVLGGEMNGNWPQEALKAQAVAARSYALRQRQQAGNGWFDLGDTPAWQVYNGITDESAGTQAAVNATEGQVLTYKGEIIEAVFHSSSGGHTENVEDIWIEPLPYLRAVADFDQGTPVYEWTKTFSGNDLSARITGVGTILAMEPEKTTPYGRVVKMRVVGSTGSRTISGADIRDALDLRSTLFQIVPQFSSTATKEKAQQVPTAFEFRGRGFGHGLGLSQWGAYNMAKKGYNYQQIVQHYYKSTTLAKIQVK